MVTREMSDLAPQELKDETLNNDAAMNEVVGASGEINEEQEVKSESLPEPVVEEQAPAAEQKPVEELVSVQEPLPEGDEVPAEPEETPAEPEEKPAEVEAPAEPEEKPAEPEAKPDEDEAPADEPAPAEDNLPKQEEQEPVNYGALGKEELVAELVKVAAKPADEIKDEVTHIKAAFFALRKDEVAAEKADFLEKGNEESAFAPADDDCENKFKELLEEIKQKRAEFNAAQEAEKVANLEKKRAIIDEIVKICDDTDNINREFNHVQQLQQDFKAIGEVPAVESTAMWKTYQATVERFYDLLKINKELRDYDFKKNLEIKQQLCADAEALDDEADVVGAFKKLQELHNSWRETGPVAKDIREEIWARFKNASSVINKKYQSFFEERKATEKANADAKTELCEKIEALEFDGLKTYASWDEMTKTIIALQDDWKKLGFASRKLNTELFARFRKKCDEFFAAKADFFKRTKEELAANLVKKNELCEKAEALKDSTDWKATTDALVELQKEWKTIGPVVKKHSDAVWKRFIGACDAFFENKKKQTSGARAAEHENLKLKREIIAKINEIVEAEAPEDAPKQVRDLMSEWQEVGHVPYREKDKIYADYKAAIDKAFDKFDMKGSRTRLANFESNLSRLGDGDKVQRERDRLVRVYEQKCSELKTYENNLGFFSARSKDGNSIVKEMERKILKLKEDIAELESKIKIIDDKAE